MASSPESRTSTFLMTDIAGSTRLWEEQPAAMAVALAAHDAILRQAVEHARGSVVKTTGDGMLAAFDGPLAAVEACVAGQRALLDHDWPTTAPLSIRMALHAGSAEARDGDFFGPALNRVARLLAIGHGGQVLVSSAGAAVLADDLPGGVELLDRGEHRLKDLSRLEHVYQLVAPGLPADFPPLRSAKAPTNLPAELTSFIGREREVAEICELLRAEPPGVARRRRGNRQDAPDAPRSRRGRQPPRGRCLAGGARAAQRLRASSCPEVARALAIARLAGPAAAWTS